jgi:toxin secretion/phage lysis holin
LKKGSVKVDKSLQIVVATGGALISYLYGGWSALLGVLLAFVVIDYALGVAASFYEGKLNSKVGAKGIVKKVIMFVIVAVAHLVDTVFGDGHLFRDATIFFYIANELLSITENAGRMGVNLPLGIKKAIEVLKSKGDQ